MNNSCRRVNVSFKNNQRDDELLKLVKSKNDKSNFIKECIEFYISNNSSVVTTTTSKKKVKF